MSKYVLAKPLKAFIEDNGEGEESYAFVSDDGMAFTFMDKDAFEELFVPLEDKKREIRKIIVSNFPEHDPAYLVGNNELDDEFYVYAAWERLESLFEGSKEECIAEADRLNAPSLKEHDCRIDQIVDALVSLIYGED